jgi:predicted RNA-binding protein with PIN domain
MLNEYCRLSRSQVEVFFDGAPTPGQTARKSGLVHPHFVRKGLSADDAIIEYARKYQNPTNLMTIVSSDHRIISAVKSVGCIAMSSDTFAVEMQRIFSSPQYIQSQRDKKPSEDEVKGWLNEFESNQIRPDNS